MTGDDFCAAARFYASLPLELLHYLTNHWLGRHMCTVWYNNRRILAYLHDYPPTFDHSRALRPFIRRNSFFFYLHRLLINFHLKFFTRAAKSPLAFEYEQRQQNQFTSLRLNCRIEKKILHKSSLLIHPWLIFVSLSVTGKRARAIETGTNTAV